MLQRKSSRFSKPWATWDRSDIEVEDTPEDEKKEEKGRLFLFELSSRRWSPSNIHTARFWINLQYFVCVSESCSSLNSALSPPRGSISPRRDFGWSSTTSHHTRFADLPTYYFTYTPHCFIFFIKYWKTDRKKAEHHQRWRVCRPRSGLNCLYLPLDPTPNNPTIISPSAAADMEILEAELKDDVIDDDDDDADDRHTNSCRSQSASNTHPSRRYEHRFVPAHPARTPWSNCFRRSGKNKAGAMWTDVYCSLRMVSKTSASGGGVQGHRTRLERKVWPSS